MIIAGILSDTHLMQATDTFTRQAKKAFQQCDVIIHAGDLTDPGVLSVFQGKEIHAVHGNMCEWASRSELPEAKEFSLGGYSFGLTHGAGNRTNIMERVWNRFPEADCIIFGHTHNALCERHGDTLFINPGSFSSTGRYGAPATYVILKIDETGLHPTIYSL